MPTVEYMDDHHLRVGDDTFWYGYPLGAEDDGATPPVLKAKDLIDQLAVTLRRLAPERIVELGIYRGGSTALIACLADPRRMIAVDLAEDPAPALERFLSERQLVERVSTHYGVDQGDIETVGRILDDAFGEELIDFVIDDASHRYAPTRASFELIFPRLRPGGLYVIEDWSAEHKLPATLIDSIDRRAPGWESMWARVRDVSIDRDDEIPLEEAEAPRRSTLVQLARRRAEREGVTPLSRLGLELLHASAQSDDVIRRIEVTWGWYVVERGTGEIPDAPWLEMLAMDLFGCLSR